MSISHERLIELSEWQTDVRDPTVPQMIVGLLMNEMKELARELLAAREGNERLREEKTWGRPLTQPPLG